MNTFDIINYDEVNIQQVTTTILFVSIIVDFSYNSSNKKEKLESDLDYKSYFNDLKGYLIKHKINIVKVSCVIIFCTVVSSIVQLYENNFIAELYLGNATLQSLFQLIVLLFFQIWTENISVFVGEWIKSPIIEDCKYNFLREIKNLRIENIDEKSEQDIIYVMNQKIKSIKAAPNFSRDICRALIYSITNILTISSVSIIWSFQIIANTYLYYKYLCMNKSEAAKELEIEKSKYNSNLSKETNRVFQDIGSFHQYNNIDMETNHQKVIDDMTKKSNKISERITSEWNIYSKIMSSISKINWLLIVFQIIMNTDIIPSKKFPIVLYACSGLTWNFSWISSSISTVINEVSSYQVYINFIKEMNNDNSNFKKIDITYYDSSVVICNNTFQKGFNQLTGRTGTGKTTFLKNLFFSNMNEWKNMSFLKQNSRHVFNDRSAKDSIVGFFEQNDDNFHKVYKCIELDKNENELLVKPSGGEIQKMRIGMCLYQALLIDTKILILDEPDNNIDVETFNNIMINIGKLFSGCIIIFTTHKGEHLSFDTKKIDIEKLL
tara:strand:- start:1373 stop:3022 length:1650 start_codon:yes stop_codon:yes gene_type:complete